MSEKKTVKVWALESGFNTENAERDKWFRQNPIFVVRHNKDTQHLLFAPVAFAYAAKYEHGEQLNAMTTWETTAAKQVEKSEDGSYRCYETASDTRYHIYQAGEITLF